MISCGQEVPLQPNEMLYELNESDGSIELSSKPNPHVNRYCFVVKGLPKADSDALIAQLIRAIRINEYSQATWTLIRQHHTSGDLRIQSLSWISRRKREGWDVLIDESLAIASKAVDRNSTESIYPVAYQRHIDGHLIMFVGMTPSLKVLVDKPTRPTIEAVVKWNRFAPSKQFLNWLGTHNFTLAYPLSHESQRFGLVIVTPQSFDIANLQSQHLIDHVYTGPNVEEAWQ